MDFLDFSEGINWRLPAWLLPQKQCVYLQNLRYSDGFLETVPGTQRYHITSLGSDPVTALMPYYNDESGKFHLLAASGGTIYRRNDPANEFTVLKSGFTKNQIYSHTIRHNVMYIPTKDGLYKYPGFEQLEKVGDGDTAPRAFQVIIWIKEVDRMFGARDFERPGLISWCDYQTPEVWDGANLDQMKFQKGEIVENLGTLYGKLIVANTYSIWVYYVGGNEENWSLESAPTAEGCIAWRTWKKVGNEYWFLSKNPDSTIGVYAFNGSTSRLLTDDITPLLERINPDKIGNCVAEIHGGLYTLSFPLDFSTVNDYSVDLDSMNLKEDGTPAIYGPHTFGFYSSCVLNTRNKDGEFLMGDESDGFVYKEGGQTFKYLRIDPETKLLIHFDGDDGGNGYTAETGQVVSFYGTAQLDTAQKKFGSSSLLLDGNSDYVSVPASNDFDFSGGVWEFDAWIRPTLASLGVIFNQRTTNEDNRMMFYLDTNGQLVFVVYAATIAVVEVKSTVGAVVANTLQHISIVESGDSYKIFVGGVDVTLSGGTSTGRPALYTGILTIGAREYGAGINAYFPGWIDEVRISNGNARWTGNFEPSRVPYEVYGGGLIPQRFLGAIHNDKSWDVEKLYKNLKIYFLPTGFHDTKLRFYLSYGPYQRERIFRPHGFGGDFNVFENRMVGIPEIFEHQEVLGVEARGKSIQIEIVNENVGERIGLQGYSYEKDDLYASKKVQSYAI